MVENEIKDLESMKAHEYPGVEENHNTEHKNKEQKLKKE
jgi:hypothetical protein